MMQKWFLTKPAKQSLMQQYDWFLLTATSCKHTHQTTEDVSQAAVHCELFTATECERRALVCVCICGLRYVRVCLCLCARWGSVTQFTLESQFARWEVVSP